MSAFDLGRRQQNRVGVFLLPRSSRLSAREPRPIKVRAVSLPLADLDGKTLLPTVPLNAARLGRQG
ncbi:hypothetical protein [Streptomyces sp. DSM 118878]